MVINSLTLFPVTSNFKFMLNKSEFPILPLINYLLPFLSLSCYFFSPHRYQAYSWITYLRGIYQAKGRVAGFTVSPLKTQNITHSCYK